MRKMKNKEDGMLIVEATIIFPIMFLVIFLMFFLGNAYFQKSRVDSIVTQMAYYGSAQCADPLLKTVQTNNKVPAYGYKYEIQPYRYMLGELGSGAGMNSIESDVEGQIDTKIKAMKSGLFSGMSPKTSSIDAEFNNAFVYTTFFVKVNYEIPFPIKLFGMSKNFSMKAAALCEVPVSDTPEFIRIVDMVGDWVESSEAGQDAIQKADEVMGKVSQFIN